MNDESITVTRPNAAIKMRPRFSVHTLYKAVARKFNLTLPFYITYSERVTARGRPVLRDADRMSLKKTLNRSDVAGVTVYMPQGYGMLYPRLDFVPSPRTAPLSQYYDPVAQAFTVFRDARPELDRRKAAIAIQAAWRGHTGRTVARDMRWAPGGPEYQRALANWVQRGGAP